MILKTPIIEHGPWLYFFRSFFGNFKVVCAVCKSIVILEIKHGMK